MLCPDDKAVTEKPSTVPDANPDIEHSEPTVLVTDTQEVPTTAAAGAAAGVVIRERSDTDQSNTQVIFIQRHANIFSGMLFEKIALTGQTYCSTLNTRNNKFLPLAATASDIFDQYYWDDSMKYVQLLEDRGFKIWQCRYKQFQTVQRLYKAAR